MHSEQEILQRIRKWAEEEASIRALVLVGSRAQDGAADELSDFDLQLFVDDGESYLNDNRWLRKIDSVWLCVSDEYIDLDRLIPTRLVIFEEGLKVDFAFYHSEMLARMRWPGPYRILYDKDGTMSTLARATENHPASFPNQQAFTRVVEEFWFEAYHVAKYLKRGELWLAKSRDWAAKAFLLQMIHWNELARGGTAFSVRSDGGNLGSISNLSTQKRLAATFGYFDGSDSWDALISMIDLFRDLGRETATKLKLSYSQRVDQNITNFVVNLWHN